MRFARLSALCLVGSACRLRFLQVLRNRAGIPFPVPPPRDENYHGGNNAMLLKYDANHDGTLTRDELIAGLKAEFAALDTSITAASHPIRRMPSTRRASLPINPPPRRSRIGTRTAASTTANFPPPPIRCSISSTKNGDGKITPQEFNPRAARPGTQNGAAPAQRRSRRGARRGRRWRRSRPRLARCRPIEAGNRLT